MASFTITGNPDKWAIISKEEKVEKFVTGPGWLDSFVGNWHQAMRAPGIDEISIYLGNISYVTLFEWTTVVALIHNLISEKNVPVKLNLFRSQDKNLLDYSKYLEVKRRRKILLPHNPDFHQYHESSRIDDIGGFIHGIDTYGTINNCFGGFSEQLFFYDSISTDSPYLKSFYVNEDKDTHTVVHGLTKVQRKQDCTIYLDDGQILDWRRTMGQRFNLAHVFQSEELWRVMCHELTANIIEHAGMPGFLSCRVVIPKPVTLQKTFRPTIGDNLWSYMKKGFVELCISDAGEGIVNTLKDSFNNQCRSFPDNPENIIAFAFDEYGTCKSEQASFRTERHALGRILHVISKYGGTITVRTDKVDLIYRSTGGSPAKRDGSCGYEPTEVRRRKHRLQGTHIQLLLPLHPIVDREKRIKRKPLLYAAAPESFRIPSHHVHSHLVPLLEQLNLPEIDKINKDLREYKIAFRANCEKLCTSLQQTRPFQEPMVFDFSGLTAWTDAHFETFLFYVQNSLINRPCLLVELSPQLAQEVHSMEDSGAASLLSQMIPEQADFPLPERQFMEAFGRIHFPVLGYDTEQRPYIFGLIERELEPVLLDLLDNPRSIAELLQDHPNINESNIRAILHENSPLFRADNNGNWSCVWDEQSRFAEINRAMSRYFDSIAERTGAWRGKSCRKQSIGKKFNLSWQNEWREDFLESSYFLTHERYVDEAAQRLIYRLRYGLDKNGYSLSDVKVLACVTGPAMLLATAMHRWWLLGETPPIVADLSYYALKNKDIPVLATDGGIVIVQDILDKHSVSGRLITLLENSRYSLLCTIGLIHLQKKEEVNKSTITSFDKGWDEKPNPFHAMINVPSPAKCCPPPISERSSEHYWVEPRSLHPVPYSALRRDNKNDPELLRRNKVLQRLDDISGCAIMSGHFIVGERHYPVAIDVRKTLLSSIGDDIASWLADICVGSFDDNRQRRDWERQEGKSFTGDVTVVLMPLHSQIHYLWTKISNILAQRGRRQPMILLDASLFTGRAPSYWVPKQFHFQLKKAFQSAIESIVDGDSNKFKPLRVLILDDAVTTAKTAKTILNSIQSCYQQVLRKFKNEIFRKEFYVPPEKIEVVTQNLSRKEYHPIQWIRYFALLDQMDSADHILWHNLHSTGFPPVPFLLEAFAPFMGVPVYRGNDCPICRDRRRLDRLQDFVKRQYATQKEKKPTQEEGWIEDYLKETTPVAIDGNVHKNSSVFLETGIGILPYKAKREYIPQHADTAIWRFYELMYLSHPIDDILNGLVNSFPEPGISENIVLEYEKYRWVVLGWCLRHWDKVEVFTAGKEFLSAAKREVDENTPIVEKIIDLCSCHYENEYIEKLVNYCIEALTDLEYAGYHGKNTNSLQKLSFSSEEDRVNRIERLKIGLYLFFENIMQSQKVTNLKENYIQSLENGVEKLNNCAGSICHVYRLYSMVTQPVGGQGVKELIKNIAQTLFRGRDSKGNLIRHNLLPKILSEVMEDPDKENCMLLDSEIRKFLLQVESLSREIMMHDPTDEDEVEHYCYRIIESLTEFRKCNYDNKNDHYDLLREHAEYLFECIDIRYDGYFVNKFSSIFYQSISEIKKRLEIRAKKIYVDLKQKGDCLELEDNGKLLLRYKCNIDDQNINKKVITPIDETVRWISNYSINPARDLRLPILKEYINIEINIYPDEDMVCFEILTNYDNFGLSSADIIKRSNWSITKANLEKFGLTIHYPEFIKESSENSFTCRLLAQASLGFEERWNGN